MSKPVSVLISDVHYSLNNLKLADAAMRMAITKANDLQVPLIVAGDLHDTKANLRGECVNAMIETFKQCDLKAIIMIGNHDKINEKSEEHSLNFLEEYVNFIVGTPRRFKIELDWVVSDPIYIIPYYFDSNELRKYIQTIPKHSILIAHQGVIGSNSGEYIQDKSAIIKDDVAGMRVISGHYHARQTIELPDGGTWDYIGNPYTINFGEANDPPKGFQILMDDGSLEFVPTNLRKHVIYEIDLSMSRLSPVIFPHASNDLVWLKVKGTREQLNNFKKPFDCRLDLIPYESSTNVLENRTSKTQPELLDQLIDSLTNTSDETKIRLKDFWKRLIE